MSRYRYTDDDYRPMRHMVEDKEATKEATYRELEEMVTEALKYMDANDITIFELEINSPQRKKSWKLTAEEKAISGRYKWEDTKEEKHE